MKIILDHFYQHLAGDVCLTVSLPPVLIEIPEPGTLKLTDLTIPGLDLVVDADHVVLQAFEVVELEFTLATLLTLFPPGVNPPDVFQKIFVS